MNTTVGDPQMNVQTGPDGLWTPIDLDRAERLLIERRRAFRVIDDEVRHDPANRRLGSSDNHQRPRPFVTCHA